MRKKRKTILNEIIMDLQMSAPVLNLSVSLRQSEDPVKFSLGIDTTANIVEDFFLISCLSHLR
jgi:hypothetical protein